MEILEILGIRPTQLGIQILGFLILFYGLKKFLWGPILGMIEQREHEVKDTYDKAEQAEKEADDLRTQYHDKVTKIEEESKQKMAEAIHKGNQMAEDIVSGARKEAEMETEKARNAIQDEATKARAGLRDFSVGLAFDLAGKVLDKEISKDTHEDLVKSFIKEMDSLEAGNA